MPIDYIGTAYSASLMIGGIMGYVKKGSVISMAAGVSTGTLAGFGAYQMSMNQKDAGLSLCISTFMTALMGYRFVMTRKIMPAGVIAAISSEFKPSVDRVGNELTTPVNPEPSRIVVVENRNEFAMKAKTGLPDQFHKKFQ